MGAFGVNGHSHAFIVDKKDTSSGTAIRWASWNRRSKRVLAGKYDLTKEKKRTRPREGRGIHGRSAGRRQREGPATGQELENLDEEIAELNQERNSYRGRAQAGEIPQGRDAISNGMAATNPTAELEKLEAPRRNSRQGIRPGGIKDMMNLQKSASDYSAPPPGTADKTKLPEFGRSSARSKLKNFSR